MNFKVSTEFTIKKRLDLQTSFKYRSPRKTSQGMHKSSYNLDFGASVDIFKKKGKLTLTLQDVLDSRKWRWESEGENFDIHGDFQWRSGRRVKLSFNYRLERSK